jgi:hypothetical protein
MRAARLGSGSGDGFGGEEETGGMRSMGAAPGDEGGNAFPSRSMPRRTGVKVHVQSPHRLKANVQNTISQLWRLESKALTRDCNHRTDQKKVFHKQIVTAINDWVDTIDEIRQLLLGEAKLASHKGI